MEQRATVLCNRPGDGAEKRYDLMEAAYPYWTGFGRNFALALLLLGVVLLCMALAREYPTIEGLNAAAQLTIASAILAVLVHSVFWTLHAQRERAGIEIIDYRNGWNTQDDPLVILHQVIANSQRWQPKMLLSSILVIAADLNLILMLLWQSFSSQSELPVLLFFFFVLPSSLMIFVDYKKVSTLATSTTQLQWGLNMLGWPGVIRYDEDL
jgi:hypothetical protein